MLDEGGHISFTRHQHVKDILAENVTGKFEERRLAIDNYWHGLRIPHPVQTNLRLLPTELVQRILADFDIAAAQPEPDLRTQTYADWLHTTYGRTFAETFPIVYGTKYHTTTMDQLVTDWIGPRMYRPTREEMLRSAHGNRWRVRITSTHSAIPRTAASSPTLSPLRSAMTCDWSTGWSASTRRRACCVSRTGLPRATRRSSPRFPCPIWLPLIDRVPSEVRAAAGQLAFTTAVLFNFGIDREDLSETAITYFYDEDIVFSRVNLPHMFSPHNAPPGCGTNQAEIYFSDKYKPLRGRPEDYSAEVLAGLRRCGFIRESDRILLQETAINRYANVIYDHDRAAAVRAIHGFLDEQKICYCGRYGDWDHAWTDQAFISGENAARKAIASL